LGKPLGVGLTGNCNHKLYINLIIKNYDPIDDDKLLEESDGLSCEED
jgi:hypothetical protein